MATLTAIFFVFGLIALMLFLQITNINDEEPRTSVAISAFVITLIITMGIHYDLNDSILPYSDFSDFLLIGSIVFLGVTTTMILLVALFRGANFSNSNILRSNFFGFLITVIGLISSLLGIASFYLDYLR